jgi:regulatory protein YycI of two-component signal transduction system YycFG
VKAHSKEHVLLNTFFLALQFLNKRLNTKKNTEAKVKLSLHKWLKAANTDSIFPAYLYTHTTESRYSMNEQTKCFTESHASQMNINTTVINTGTPNSCS